MIGDRSKIWTGTLNEKALDPQPHRVVGLYDTTLRDGEIQENMVLAIEPGCYWEGGGGLRVEDNFLITGGGAEKLSTFPDGIVQA